MITTNIDVEDGLVNGACGVLRHIKFDGSGESPLVLFIEFSATNIGRKARQQHEALMKSEKDISSEWVPLRKLTKAIQTAQTTYEIFRTQFSVTPTEAVTIHKSQGQTYDSVCVNVNSRGITRQKLYVACNRVTSLSGLYLIGKFKAPNAPKSDDKAINAITKLKTQKQPKLAFNDLSLKTGTIIAYHNVRSYSKHHKHIENDSWYMKCDVLIMAETLTKQQQNIDMPNYRLLHRIDCRSPTYTGRGMAVFVSEHIDVGVRLLKPKEFTTSTGCLYLLPMKVDTYFVIAGYKSPKYSTKEFLFSIKSLIQAIEETFKYANIVIMGDFNIDSLQLKQHLNSFKSQLKPNEQTMLTSTNQIDVIFANFDGMIRGTYCSYFSDHLPTFCMFNKDNIPLELFQSS